MNSVVIGVLSLSIGSGAGVAIGAALKNIPLGMTIGSGVGLLVGVIINVIRKGV